MKILIHLAVLERKHRSLLVRGMRGTKVSQQRGEADADFEGIHFGRGLARGPEGAEVGVRRGRGARGAPREGGGCCAVAVRRGSE